MVLSPYDPDTVLVYIFTFSQEIPELRIKYIKLDRINQLQTQQRRLHPLEILVNLIAPANYFIPPIYVLPISTGTYLTFEYFKRENINQHLVVTVEESECSYL